MQTFATEPGVPETIAVDAAEALESLRDAAVFLVDRRGLIASWNEGVGKILGWERADWIGQPLHLPFTPEDTSAGVPQLELRRAAATGRADDTRWMLRKSGERFYAHGVLTRLKTRQGTLVGYLKALYDGTEQQRQHAEMSHALLMNAQLKAWAEHLEAP